MAKEKVITRVAKLEFMGGQAKPGPELAGLGLVMPNFTREFNDLTRSRANEPVPVTITVYNDKSHSMVIHTAPTAYKIREAAKIPKGSNSTKANKVGTITADDVRKIAIYKMPDMNTDSVDAAIKSVVGTAKQMGVLVEGHMDVKAEREAAAALKLRQDALKKDQPANEKPAKVAAKAAAPKADPKAASAKAADTKGAAAKPAAPAAKKGGK